MEDNPSDITRLEVMVPLNENTFEVVEKIRDYVVRIFGGITNSRLVYPSAFEGYWSGATKPENVAMFVVYYRMQDHPRALDALKSFAKMLLQTGEVETWLVFQPCSRIVHRRS